MITVPAAHGMLQWQFLKHIRLRHPHVRDATYEAHHIDHDRGRSHDHEHVRSGSWATVPEAEALQEKSSYRPPVFPAARQMKPGLYIAHERDQHGCDFRPFAEHDREHEEWPDMQDHVHKEES